MAKKEKLALRLEFDYGKDDKGKTILRSKSFSNVNQAATDDALLRGGQVISSLYEKPCSGILKIETVRLNENPEA